MNCLSCFPRALWKSPVAMKCMSYPNHHCKIHILFVCLVATASRLLDGDTLDSLADQIESWHRSPLDLKLQRTAAFKAISLVLQFRRGISGFTSLTRNFSSPWQSSLTSRSSNVLFIDSQNVLKDSSLCISPSDVKKSSVQWWPLAADRSFAVFDLDRLCDAVSDRKSRIQEILQRQSQNFVSEFSHR